MVTAYQIHNREREINERLLGQRVFEGSTMRNYNKIKINKIWNKDKLKHYFERVNQ